MPAFLEFIALWLALDIVLAAGWHAAHVRQRRPRSATGGAGAAPAGPIQATFQVDREHPELERRPPLAVVGASRT